jgi:hypothetical protein
MSCATHSAPEMPAVLACRDGGEGESEPRFGVPDQRPSDDAKGLDKWKREMYRAESE